MALDWSRRARLNALAPAWMLASIMGLVVGAATAVLPPTHMLLELIGLIGLGIGVYLILLAAFGRETMVALLAHLPLRRKPT